MNVFERLWGWISFHTPTTPIYANETDGNALWNKMLQGECVECDTESACFYEGSAGGMNLNIFCSSCGQGYNVSPILGWAEKIHKDEKYIKT